MIDAMYNYRQGEIHSAEFSDEINQFCIPFEDSLSEEQIDVFHKILDCVSDTAADEMSHTTIILCKRQPLLAYFIKETSRGTSSARFFMRWV